MVTTIETDDEAEAPRLSVTVTVAVTVPAVDGAVQVVLELPELATEPPETDHA